MLPSQIGLGPLGISTFGLFAFLAFFLGSFLLWRKLREDYPEEEILSLFILATLSALIGARIIYSLDHLIIFGFDLDKWLFFPRYPGFSLVGGYLGTAGFVYYWCKLKKWSLWVVADSFVQSVLAILIIGNIGNLFLQTELITQPSSQVFTIANLLLAVLALLLSFYFASKYRKFLWYKSGKPGFVATSISAFYFLWFSVLDFSYQKSIYLELVGALLTVLVALVLLYIRSDRILREDLSFLDNFKKIKFKI
ncbi:MAG: prolipoprotein diacylglyceryl transferase [bacterium]|nr:prolipoprotein diacylglyceryl transferase [bacterium]